MDSDIYHMIANVVLIIISMLWVNYHFLKDSKEFWASIKGEDKLLQITEMCIYIWIRLFPLVVLCDLFADLDLSSEAWYSMDAIFFILILGDLGHKAFNNKYNNGNGTSEERH